LGSSARLAAMESDCTVVVVRSTFKFTKQTVFMVGIDGSAHAHVAFQSALRLARSGDDVVVRIFGPERETQMLETEYTKLLQQAMDAQALSDYAVVAQASQGYAAAVGQALATMAEGLPSNSLLVFGAFGQGAAKGGTPTPRQHLGSVAKWCIENCGRSLVICKRPPLEWCSPPRPSDEGV